MAGPLAGGGGEQLRQFRRLADLTAVVTFLLIVVGGIVRVSQSGLGCGPGGSGTKGWPLCGGQVIPLVGNENRVIEFSHRLLATVVVVLIAVLCWRAYKHLREGHGWALRGSLIAGVLVLVQAVLGGLTVEHSLAEELVAAHLGTAMLLLGLLLWLGAKARSEAATEAGAATPGEAAGAGAQVLRGRRDGPALLRDRCRRIHGRHRGGGGERHRAEHRGSASRLRSPVPDLRRRQVPALREQPADRHPPHPPGLRLSGDDRDHRPAQRGLRARLARPAARPGRAPACSVSSCSAP